MRDLEDREEGLARDSFVAAMALGGIITLGAIGCYIGLGTIEQYFENRKIQRNIEQAKKEELRDEILEVTSGDFNPAQGSVWAMEYGDNVQSEVESWNRYAAYKKRQEILERRNEKNKKRFDKNGTEKVGDDVFGPYASFRRKHFSKESKDLDDFAYHTSLNPSLGGKNYAFEGEQIGWKVLVMDKNGDEDLFSVDYPLLESGRISNDGEEMWE